MTDSALSVHRKKRIYNRLKKCCYPSQQNTVKRRSCRVEQPASVSCNLSTPTRFKGYFTVGATVSHALRPAINISLRAPTPPPYNPRQGPSFLSSEGSRMKPSRRLGAPLQYQSNRAGRGVPTKRPSGVISCNGRL